MRHLLCLFQNSVSQDVSLVIGEKNWPYFKSIENKQIAQQQAFQAKYTVMQAAEEKKQKIVAAQGEAERFDFSLLNDSTSC